jgi:hypothetical protein
MSATDGESEICLLSSERASSYNREHSRNGRATFGATRVSAAELLPNSRQVDEKGNAPPYPPRLGCGGFPPLGAPDTYLLSDPKQRWQGNLLSE